MFIIHIMFFFIFIGAVIEYLAGPKLLKSTIPFFLIILICLAAFRPDGMDRDSPVYIDFLNDMGTPAEYFSDSEFFLLFEPTFYLIPTTWKALFGPEYFTKAFFIIFAILGVFFKIQGILKLSEFFLLSLLIYFSNFFILHELTQIRGGIASGIFLFSLPFLYRKQYWKYTFWIFIACLFHYASIILFALLLIDKLKIPKIILITLLGVTFLLAFINNSLLDNLIDYNAGPFSQKVELYKNLTENQIDGFGDINKFNLLFILQFFSALVFIFYQSNIEKKNAYAPLLIKSMVIGLFLFQLFSSLPAIAFRTSEMFLAVNIIAFTFYIHIFKYKIIGFTFVVAIALALFYLNIYYNKVLYPIEYF